MIAKTSGLVVGYRLFPHVHNGGSGLEPRGAASNSALTDTVHRLLRHI